MKVLLLNLGIKETKDKNLSKKMLLHKKSAPSGMIAGSVTLSGTKMVLTRTLFVFLGGKNKKKPDWKICHHLLILK
ncbi:MAG: hypothetical protein Ct9H300mP21_10750 [Pseudomonadota bacterium]|nr:MAG: hypothetical protein Ct9H300mP21_10750 [Pseudomonadota bacterium]